MSLTLEKELEMWKLKAKANYDLAEGRAKLLNKIQEKLREKMLTAQTSVEEIKFIKELLEALEQ